MKRTILFFVAFLLLASTGWAQKYMVVNTEKIFKTVPEYTRALEALETEAQRYQAQIDSAYASIERLYNTYQAQKEYLSQAVRTARENEILEREDEVQRYQAQIFGQEGTLIKRRVEILKPITDRIAETVKNYAAANGYGLVLDTATNPAILYYTPDADKTGEIIELLK